ncbi:MAG TPA: glycosyltransferase, partial [Verrucomicrobiae bacterium]|nr:glycosyltransferase [Verrucomicrobiae bacterium]
MAAANPPRISVLIPTYNYARFLPEAIESVLAQDFRDFELLIV